MDGKKRMGTIRGTMRKRVWINTGDIVLLGLREFGDDAKCDIIMKYFDEEAQELQELGEIPEHIQIAVGGFGIDEGEGMGAGSDSEDDDDEEEEQKAPAKITAKDIDDI